MAAPGLSKREIDYLALVHLNNEALRIKFGWYFHYIVEIAERNIHTHELPSFCGHLDFQVRGAHTAHVSFSAGSHRLWW